jgi:hypothetical protein
MQYQVLSNNELEVLVELVNDALEEGWVLQGGVSIAFSRDGGYTSELYAQAMIRK